MNILFWAITILLIFDSIYSDFSKIALDLAFLRKHNGLNN